MTGMMTALNIAYAQPEGRDFASGSMPTLVLTVVVIFGGLIALALVAGLPAMLNAASGHGPGRWVAGRRMAASNRVRHEYYCTDLPLRA